MVKAGLAFIVAIFVVGWTPHPASAATCSDYSTQADAQRAMDTRDADGDGIYCESLPCPCLSPGHSSGGGGNPTPAPSPKPKARARARRASSASSSAGRSTPTSGATTSWRSARDGRA
jgi:hypothetical protein